MSIADQPNSGWYFNLHKSFGLVAAMLIFFRLIWRLTHKTSSRRLSVRNWQSIVSKRGIHFLLYLCMLIMPITGFIGASFGEHGIIFFGVKLPHWFNQSHAVSEQFFSVHEVVAWILVGFVALHILVAIKHLVINKNKVFQRMWF
jgi:cytochrome b561